MKHSFDIQPLIGPLPLRFGMSEDQVCDLLGPPQDKSINRRKEPDWDYGEFSIRFGCTGGGVVEVGFLPEAELNLFGLDLFGDPKSFNEIVSKNSDVFESYGFIIIPSLGLTFTGFHDGNEGDKAITVFARGRWDEKSNELQPFARNMPKS